MPDGRGVSAVGHSVRRVARSALALVLTVCKDLTTIERFPPPTFPRPVWLRRLPQALIVLAFIGLTVSGTLLLFSKYQQSAGISFLLAAAHASALLIAMARPMLGWWVSVAMSFAIAMVVYPSPVAGFWPWPSSSQWVHIGVVFLVASRVRPRVTMEVLAQSVLLGVLLRVTEIGHGYSEPSQLTTYAFTISTGVALSLYSRRQFLIKLVNQERLTTAEQSRSALLEERNRIARELHDVVAHHMSVIAIQAESAPRRSKDIPREVDQSLRAIRKNAVEALDELRRVLGVLRAGELDISSPDAPQPDLRAVDGLLAGVRAAGVSVEKQICGEARPLSAGVELSAYRIVQEALSNSMRHSPGSAVHVVISYRRTSIGLRITNGPPTETTGRVKGSGHGLVGMQERVTMLGGDFSAGATPDGGYEVVAQFPVRS